MPVPSISNNGILSCLNRHIENGRKAPSAGRPAQPALVAFALIAFFCALKSAAASTPLGLSSNNISFGSVVIGSTETQSVTLRNEGPRYVRVVRATVIGAGFSISGLALPLTLDANQSTTFEVSFGPTASGSVTGTITIECSFSYNPAAISLSGTGVASFPSALLSATSLVFGNQSVGAPSTAQTVTLSNTGNAVLTIAGITLTGANPSDFSQSNNCGSSVAAGYNCTISVAFIPAAGVSYNAAVTISDNAAGSPQSVSLAGTGTAPGGTISPTSISFGSQSLGSTSSAQTATLSNNGSAALAISSLAITGANSGDFAQTNTCGSSVAAGGSCTISVTFTPTASGIRTASVTVTDNATGSPQSVSLSGTATAPVITLSPTSIAFGTQPIATTTSAETISVTNGGNSALNISSLAITGANAGDFAEIGDTCGTSVAAGGNCTVGITFTPSLAGAETASVSITDNASGSPQSVTLSGTGGHDVILTWSASTSAGVGGYNVYRGTTSGGESAAPINSSLITGTTYTDSNVQAGQTYYYVLIAMSSDETSHSADSSEVSASVPSP